MQTTLSADERQNTNKILAFVENLSENEKNDFSVFIKGFELGKQIGAKSKATS